MNRKADRGRATRDRLMEIALRLFAEHGYEGTSIEAVLAESQVSRGALYHHFPGKEALFEAVLEKVEADIARRTAQAGAIAAGGTVSNRASGASGGGSSAVTGPASGLESGAEGEEIEADGVDAGRGDADGIEADRVDAYGIEADGVQTDGGDAGRGDADGGDADGVQADGGDADRVQADGVDALRAGCLAWVRLAGDPVVRRVVLVDAPAVVGWHRWREIEERHGFGLLKAALQNVADQGRFPPERVEVFAHMLLAAMNEVALLIARSDGDPAMIAEGEAAVEELLDRLLTS